MNNSIEMTTVMASAFHEIKNLMGQLTLTLDEAVVSSAGGANNELGNARATCHRISDRLVQLLTLYKNETENLELNVEAHSPADFIEELAAEATSLSGDRISIVTDVEQAPPFWFFDRYLLEIALHNAVHNALTHSRSQVHLSAKAQDGGLLFCVRDDGAGFSRAHPSGAERLPTRSERGTGLGLHFAHVVAQAHSNHGKTGRLHLENQAGGVFCMWLP